MTVGCSGIGGKRLFEGNGRDIRWIVSDFVRALNEATELKMAWVSGWWINCIVSLFSSCIVEREDHEFREAEQGDVTINLNIAGVRHQIPLSTLREFPDTKLARLADYHQRKINNGSCSEDLANEYYFNRHPGVFQNIIDLYRTGKIMQTPRQRRISTR
jgi:hypothetical protein